MKVEKIKSFDGTMLSYKKDVVNRPKAIVLIIHGLCEHMGRYDYLVSRLNANSYATYRFDHRGHGLSEGKSVYLENYDDLSKDSHTIFQLAKKEYPELPIFILGHSMGGYTASLFAADYKNEANGFILSGALTRDNKELIFGMEEGLDPNSYVKNELYDSICSDKSVVEAYTKDPLVKKEISIAIFYALAKGIKQLKSEKTEIIDPILILHGAKDEIVSCCDSTQLYCDIQSDDKELIIYSNLWHEILNEFSKDKVIADILYWIKERI